MDEYSRPQKLIASAYKIFRGGYAISLLSDQKIIKLVKRMDGETLLAEIDFDWEFGLPYDLQLSVQGNQIQAWVNGRLLFTVEDTARPLSSGGIGLVCEEGRMMTDSVSVMPISEGIQD